MGLVALDRDAGLYRDPERKSQALENFYNNAYYAATLGSLEYRYEDGEETESSTAPLVRLNNGLGVRGKTGLSKSSLEIVNEDNSKVQDYMEFFQKPLTLMGANGVQNEQGVNLIGNCQEDKSTDLGLTVKEPLTDLDLEIRRNNTGFFFTYYAPDGSVERCVKSYDRDALSKLDEDYIYVGLMTARCGDATFSDVTLTLIDPKDDAPAEEKDLTYHKLDCGFYSSPVANSDDYELRFKSNWDAEVTMTVGDKLIYDGTCDADEMLTVENVSLDYGSNEINAVIKPDEDYHPDNDEKNVLEDQNYGERGMKFTVHRIAYGKEGCYLFVAPDGGPEGLGTRKEPLDIYTAVKYVQKGQAIVLKPGRYDLSSRVVIERGINGTEDEPIYMLPDDNDTSEGVLFDFNSSYGGILLQADHWIILDINITGREISSGSGGLTIYGSHNIIDGVTCYGIAKAYGFQLKRSGEERKDTGLWPHDNTILNCNTHDNYRGLFMREVGENNVVDGLIANNNSEYGVSVQTNLGFEPSGPVTFKNCVSYFNGYTHDKEGRTLSSNLESAKGFTVGGGSQSIDHKLVNCYAFYNTGDGFTTASGRACTLKDSVFFNNERTNVELHTNYADSEDRDDESIFDYKADNVISFRTPGPFPECLGLPDAISSPYYGDVLYSKKKIDQNSAYFMTLDQEKMDSVCMNKNGQEFLESYFKSTELTENTISRNEDNTVNMGDFLALREDLQDAVPSLSAKDLLIKGTPSRRRSVVFSQLTESAGEKFGQEVNTAIHNGRIMSIFSEEEGADIIQIVNNARENAQGTNNAPESISVPQAYGDSACIEETYVKGKVKGRLIAITVPGETNEITLNTGVKYILGDFDPAKYNELKIVQEPKKNTVKITKVGVMTLKANGEEGYKAIVKYKSLSKPGAENTLVINAENLKPQKPGLVDSSLDEFEVHLSTFGGGLYYLSCLLSAKWSIANTVLIPGQWVTVYKDKKHQKVLAQAYLALDNSFVRIKGDKEGQFRNGNIKVVAEVNGKKLKTTVKFKVPYVNKTSASMQTGQTLKFRLKNTKLLPEWKSLDESVAVVDGEGKVTALKAGQVNITATVDGASYLCAVTVVPPVIKKAKLSVRTGRTVTVRVKDTRIKEIHWSSSDESTATVDDQGKVRGIKKGEATISATVGGVLCECRVTVI